MQKKKNGLLRKPEPLNDIFSRVCASYHKVEVVKEYRFHPKRMWRFDYAIPVHKVAIEVEGATFKKTTYRDKKTGEKVTVMGGRHGIGEGYLNDMEKYNTATVMGWKVLRVTPSKLINSATIDLIGMAIRCE